MSKRLKRAYSKLKGDLQHIEEVRTKLKRRRPRLDAIAQTIDAYRSKGIRIDDGAKRRLGELKRRFKQLQFAEFDLLEEQLAAELTRTRKRYETARELDGRVGATLEKYRDLLYVAEVASLHDDARELFTNGAYEKASALCHDILAKIEKMRESGKPLISLAIPVECLVKNQVCKSTVRISNSGKVAAKDVAIKLSSKFFDFDELDTLPFIRPGETKELECGLVTEKEGSIPVNTTIDYLHPMTKKRMRERKKIWVETTGLTTQQPTSLKILRESEFFAGFIRVKIGVVNESSAVITDTIFTPIFDTKVFRISHIEPDYMMVGNEIHLGNVSPKEKRSLALYLDPQMCTTSDLDGTLAFKNSAGRLMTATMRKKQLNVVCPIFFTKEEANPAMLRNLIESKLGVNDSKIFTIPYGIPIRRAMDIAREVVQMHDIKFVREYRSRDRKRIEAYYYGITKVKKTQIVVQIIAQEKTHSLGFHIATSSPETLTGFLAELGSHLDEKFLEKGVEKPLQLVTNIDIKDSIIQRSNFLFGEGAPGANGAGKRTVTKRVNVNVEDSVIQRSKMG